MMDRHMELQQPGSRQIITNEQILTYISQHQELLSAPDIEQKQSLAALCLNTKNLDLLITLITRFPREINLDTPICKKAASGSTRMVPIAETLKMTLQLTQLNRRGQIQRLFDLIDWQRTLLHLDPTRRRIEIEQPHQVAQVEAHQSDNSNFHSMPAQSSRKNQNEETLFRAIKHDLCSLLLERKNLPARNQDLELNNDQILDLVTQNRWLLGDSNIRDGQSLAALCINARRPHLLTALIERFSTQIDLETPICKRLPCGFLIHFSIIETLQYQAQNPTEPDTFKQKTSDLLKLILTLQPDKRSHEANPVFAQTEQPQDPALSSAAQSSNSTLPSQKIFRHNPYGQTALPQPHQ